MLEHYKTIYEGGEGELVEKNPVSSQPSVLWKQKKRPLPLSKK